MLTSQLCGVCSGTYFMARKHKRRTLLKPISVKERYLRDFQQRLNKIQQQLEGLQDQHIALLDTVLARKTWRNRKARELVREKLILLRQQTRELQGSIALRQQWIRHLTNSTETPAPTLAQSIQQVNKESLVQRGLIKKYPRTSFYSHWSQPPLGDWEPRRSSDSIPTAIVKVQRQPINLATRTSATHPIDLVTCSKRRPVS